MTLELSGGSSSGLLLRLFESSFFNVHLAIGYLKTYPTSIGITHYLVNRLKSFDATEVEFYWAQLCYLVITRPTPSVALENFVLERCELDPHIAVITLWYFQSALSDLSATPTTVQFNVCKRVFNRVQSIIFTDPPNPTTISTSSISSPLESSISPRSSIAASFSSDITPSQSSSTSTLSWIRSKPIKKINSTLASLVGIGAIGASIGSPLVAISPIGKMTVDQGCAVDNGNLVSRDSDDSDYDEDEESESEDDDQGIRIVKPSLPPKVMNLTAKKLPASPKSKGKKVIPPTLPKPKIDYLPGARLEASSPISSTSSNFSFNSISSPSTPSSSSNKTVKSTSPYLPSSPLPSTNELPKWQSNEPPIANPNSRSRPSRFDAISLSAPSLPMATQSASYLPTSNRSSTLPFNNPLLEPSSSAATNLPAEFLSHLLKLQSCRSQLDLLRSLQDISTRLVLVPKQARLSSLRAELTVLNHGLPRGCCLCMSCSGSSFGSTSSSSKTKSHPHDRIVRISPSESAVLNSADRAPFVIHVEVLTGDLDFDPFRRQNAEDLRRALMEREKSMNGRGGGLDKESYKGRMSLESGLDSSNYNSTNAIGNGRRTGEISKVDLTMSDQSDLSSGIESLGLSLLGSSTSNLVLGREVGGKGKDDINLPREMDMVEQLYGDVSTVSELKVRTASLDDSIANKEVDELAWSRTHDINGKDLVDASRPTTPFIVKLDDSTSIATNAISRSLSPVTTSLTPTAPSTLLRPTISTRPTISLDQYAERMRMAAIMLSQLDASQTAAMSVVATGTAAAGTLVGLPVATVAGIGGVLGSGLAKLSAPFLRRDVQAGQASTGVNTSLDKLSAAAGTSSVAGAPPLSSLGSSKFNNSSSTINLTSVPLNHNHRQRLLSPLEATAIRNRIMDEMIILEEERMLRMKIDGNARSGWISGVSPGGSTEDGAVVMRAVNKDDPSGAVFRESFAAKTSRIRAASPYGHLASWNVISVIVKTGADLRQEQLAIQLIKEFGRIWKEENCTAWVRYFRILVTSEGSGLIETITDAVSIHSIKKDAYARTATDGTQVFTSFTLLDHYLESYGSVTSPIFRKAQQSFVSSLAAYSVICYLLQLKDRHNGNILVDKDGHLIHIDFGFMLSNSPGSLGFEMAPFKLPQEYIDVLGGYDSENFAEFKSLFKRAFRAARKHAERIITLVELMQKDSNLPCFANGESTSSQLRERFQLSLTTTQCDEFVERLILSAATSSFTRLYDLFQGYSNGIL